jgi:hypothetical protein
MQMAQQGQAGQMAQQARPPIRESERERERDREASEREREIERRERERPSATSTIVFRWRSDGGTPSSLLHSSLKLSDAQVHEP